MATTELTGTVNQVYTTQQTIWLEDEEGKVHVLEFEEVPFHIHDWLRYLNRRVKVVAEGEMVKEIEDLDAPAAPPGGAPGGQAPPQSRPAGS